MNNANNAAPLNLAAMTASQLFLTVVKTASTAKDDGKASTEGKGTVMEAVRHLSVKLAADPKADPEEWGKLLRASLEESGIAKGSAKVYSFALSGYVHAAKGFGEHPARDIFTGGGTNGDKPQPKEWAIRQRLLATETPGERDTRIAAETEQVIRDSIRDTLKDVQGVDTLNAILLHVGQFATVKEAAKAEAKANTLELALSLLNGEEAVETETEAAIG